MIAFGILFIIVAVALIIMIANTWAGDFYEYFMLVFTFLILILGIALIYLSGQNSISNQSLRYMSEAHIVELKVDKNGDENYILKDSSSAMINFYNFLEGNK